MIDTLIVVKFKSAFVTDEWFWDFGHIQEDEQDLWSLEVLGRRGAALVSPSFVRLVTPDGDVQWSGVPLDFGKQTKVEGSFFAIMGSVFGAVAGKKRAINTVTVERLCLNIDLDEIWAEDDHVSFMNGDTSINLEEVGLSYDEHDKLCMYAYRRLYFLEEIQSPAPDNLNMLCDTIVRSIEETDPEQVCSLVTHDELDAFVFVGEDRAMSQTATILQKNAGDDFFVSDLLVNSENEICLIQMRGDATRVAMIHFQDLMAGVGTTYFIGSEPAFAGNLSILDDNELKGAVGSALFDIIKERLSTASV